MANKNVKKLIFDILYPAIVVVGMLVLWQVLALVLDANLVLPTPKQAFKQFFVYCGQGEFWLALASTFWRATYSFALAFVVAVVFAVFCCLSDVARKIILPFFAVVRSVPTMSIILILVIWMSPSFAPVVVAIIVTAPTLFSAFLASVDSVDKKLVEMSKVYKVSAKDVVFTLYLPNMASQLFENCASGFSLNLKLIIAAEALAYTSKSVGKLMQFAKINIEPTQLFALTLFAMVLGVVAESVIRQIGKRVVRWQK